MTEQENIEPTKILKSALGEIKAKAGISEEIELKLIQLEEKGLIVGATKDMAFDIHVKNGKGSYTNKATTAWVTIQGDLVINSPSDGTWTVVAKADGNVVVNQKGVKAGDHVKFKYRTGFTLTLDVNFTWSEKKDTTLKGIVHASY